MPADLNARLWASRGENWWKRRSVRMSTLVVLVLIVFLVCALVPGWIMAGVGGNTRSLRRQVATTFMNVVLTAYIATLIVAVAGMAVLSYWCIRSRKRGSSDAKSRRLQLRLVLLCTSTLLSLMFLETGAAFWRRWLHRSPDLPSVKMPAKPAALSPPIAQHFGRESEPPSEAPVHIAEKVADPGALRILVIGESSGRGEPYHPWLSVGDIVAWRLKNVFPGRSISVDMWARGGAILEEMHKKLAGLTYRPDALIVYLGHNEFQGRFAWGRDVSYYHEPDQAGFFKVPQVSSAASVLRYSPLCSLIIESLEKKQIEVVPPHVVTRTLVDVPAYTAEEFAAILADFQRRWNAIASYCESIGTLPIFVVPPSNDGGYDPSRSVMAAETPRNERISFARAVAQARALEDKDPSQAIRIDRELIERHPEFAETHYRLARLLERTGQWGEAREHYLKARECDAMPMRCPEPLRQAIRDVAARHPAVLLVDGPKVLEAKSLHGILDDHFFHDAQHPNLSGYAALAEDLLKQLSTHRAFGWPAGRPVPVVDFEICRRHYKIGPERLTEICRREAWFFGATAYMRYDPVFRNGRAAAYLRAAAAMRDGRNPASAGIPSWTIQAGPSSSHRVPRNQDRYSFLKLP